MSCKASLSALRLYSYFCDIVVMMLLSENKYDDDDDDDGDTVTKSDKCKHKIGHNTACCRDNMYAILSLWVFSGLAVLIVQAKNDSNQPLLP